MGAPGPRPWPGRNGGHALAVAQVLNVVYWLGMALFGIVAAAGVAVGATVIMVACILGTALLVIFVVPVLAWAALFDSSRTLKVFKDIKYAIKAPKQPQEN